MVIIKTLDRRTGGLEITLKAMLFHVYLDRRTGGLENTGFDA